MNIAFETPDQPDIIALIADLDAYQLTLYPPESVYALDLASLKQPNVLFAVARNADGAALGCGAMVVTPQFAEVKRMYVRPEARGQGLAKRMLSLLEQEAAQRGSTQYTLETGPSQPEAIALYERLGYQRCGPYGDYRDDPLSVFMRKTVP